MAEPLIKSAVSNANMQLIYQMVKDRWCLLCCGMHFIFYGYIAITTHWSCNHALINQALSSEGSVSNAHEHWANSIL